MFHTAADTVAASHGLSFTEAENPGHSSLIRVEGNALFNEAQGCWDLDPLLQRSLRCQGLLAYLGPTFHLCLPPVSLNSHKALGVGSLCLGPNFLFVERSRTCTPERLL